MSSGIWSTTSSGSGSGSGVVRLALVLAPVALVAWAIVEFLVLPIYRLLGATGCLLLIAAVVGIEVGAAFSAALDWLEADVELVTKRQAWLYAHWTMARRCVQRVAWWWGLARALVTLGSRRVEPPAVADEPVSLALVVDMRKHREERGAA